MPAPARIDSASCSVIPSFANSSIYCICGAPAGADARVLISNIAVNIKISTHTVAEDIYDTDTVKTLAVCGCDFIVCPFERVRDAVCSVLLRAYAFTAGVPIVFCGGGYAMIADVNASIAFAAPIGYTETDFVVKKEFHLIENRRKLYLR